MTILEARDLYVLKALTEDEKKAAKAHTLAHGSEAAHRSQRILFQQTNSSKVGSVDYQIKDAQYVGAINADGGDVIRTYSALPNRIKWIHSGIH